MAATENGGLTVSLSTIVDSPVSKIMSTPKLLKHLVNASANFIPGTDLVRLVSFSRTGSQLLDSDSDVEIVVNAGAYAQETFKCDKILADAFPILKNIERENRKSMVIDNTNRCLLNMGLRFDAYAQTVLLAACAHADNTVTRTADMAADIRSLKMKLDLAGVGPEGRKLALTSAHMNEVLAKNILTEYQFKGEGSAIETGVVKKAYGFEIIDYIPTGAISIAFVPDAAQYAIQGKTEMTVEDKGTLLKLVYSIWDKVGCFAPAQSVAGKSPFVFSLVNA